MGIGIYIGNMAGGSSSGGGYWTRHYYILRSGPVWYRREINNAGGYFKLDYSEDGVTWETLTTLDLTENLPVIDLAHIYHHRIVDYEYRVDNFINPLGYAGVEGVDWENLYTTSPYHVLLPQKLIVTPATVLDEMDATTGWAGMYSTTIESNITEKHSGNASIKMTPPGVGQNLVMDKTVNWDLSADSGMSFRLWEYAHTDPVVTNAGTTIYLSSDAGFGNYFIANYGIDYPLLIQDKWTLIFGNNWVVGAGAPDWSHIVKIRIVVGSKAGQMSICSFDLTTEGEVKKPSVMIFFDDCSISDYTLAYPLLRTKKMVSTHYYIGSSYPGNGVTWLNLSQLMEMNNYGCDIANHTMTHSDLRTLTQQQIETELSDCKTLLDGMGLIRASSHVAYPGGFSNSTVLAAMAAWNAKTGRSVDGSVNANNYANEWPYLIGCYMTDSTKVLSDLITYVTNCLAIGVTPGVLFHGLVNSAPAGYLTSVSIFSSFLDYLESEGYQTLTISEYDRLYSAAITVFHK